MGVVQPCPLEVLALGVRHSGIAWTEVRCRDPSRGKERDIGPAQFGPHFEPVAGDKRFEQRIPEPGSSRRRQISDFDGVTVVECGSERVAYVLHRFFAGTIRSETVVDQNLRFVGNYVACDSSADVYRLQRLAVLTALNDGSTGLVGVDDRKNSPKAVNGVTTHPRASGMRTRSRQGHFDSQRALATGF